MKRKYIGHSYHGESDGIPDCIIRVYEEYDGSKFLETSEGYNCTNFKLTKESISELKKLVETIEADFFIDESKAKRAKEILIRNGCKKNENK